ncbi:acyl carrier protein [Luteolibacter luteus]|uniref:acyl carrier protein n=1 Tax=Luteolibacter luteus TaxID=2728835 RepID=UPI00197B84CF|nr:acyl carrier protein [Luteolibacter luteus]
MAASLEASEVLGSPIAWGFVAAALVFGGIFFMVSIVKAFTRQTTGWIVTAVVSAIVALIGLFGAISMSAKAATRMVQAKKERAVPKKKHLVSGDGKFTLDVPGTWTEMPGLRREASIAAGDDSLECYVLVIETPKFVFLGSLAEYEDAASRLIGGKIDNSELGEPRKTQIGELPALRRRFTGSSANIGAVYHQAAIETKTAFYQVLTWTSRSREKEAKPVFEGVINSFTSHAGPPGAADASLAPEVAELDHFGRIRQIVVDHLGVLPQQVIPGARFAEELGAEGQDTFEIVAEAEGEFGVTIPAELSEKIRTVGELQDLLEAELRKQSGGE